MNKVKTNQQEKVECFNRSVDSSIFINKHRWPVGTQKRCTNKLSSKSKQKQAYQFLPITLVKCKNNHATY